MRQSLIDFINDVIIFEYQLPNTAVGIPKTILSTHNDHCYNLAKEGNLADGSYEKSVIYWK